MADFPANVVWPNPIVTDYVPANQDYVVSLVLRAAAPKPFTQMDWPLSIRVRPTGQFWTALPIPSRIPNVKPPNRQSDWPQVLRPSTTHLLGWRQSPQIKPLPPPGIFSQDDWPVPQRPRPLNTGFSEPGNVQLPFVSAKPFNQTDWPIPQRPPYPVQLLSWIESGNALLPIAITYMPGRVTDWGIPPTIPPSGQFWTQHAQITGAVVAGNPFNQTDWPVPQAPQYPISLRGFIDQGIGAIVTYVPRIPFYVRRPDVQIVIQWQAPNTLPLLTTPAVKPPNYQWDWPVPLRPGRSVSSYTNINTPIIIPNPAPPNRQSNWPLPPRLPPPVGQFWANTPRPGQIPNAKPPNYQWSWPVPAQPQQPSSVYFWSNTPRVIPPAVPTTPPFDPFVWSEADWRKHQKRLKKRQQQLEKEDKQKAKLREKLLNLYRGIDDEQFAQLPTDDILPVRLQAREDHLDQIALQLLQMQDLLNRHQRELVRRYLADVESKRDEEEIEMLMSSLL